MFFSYSLKQSEATCNLAFQFRPTENVSRDKVYLCCEINGTFSWLHKLGLRFFRLKHPAMSFTNNSTKIPMFNFIDYCCETKQEIDPLSVNVYENIDTLNANMYYTCKITTHHFNLNENKLVNLRGMKDICLGNNIRRIFIVVDNKVVFETRWPVVENQKKYPCT